MISACLCTHLSLYLPYGWKQAALRYNRINLFLLSLCTIFVIIGKEAIDETICDHSSRRKRNSYGKRHSQTIHRNSRQTDISPYDRNFYRFDPNIDLIIVLPQNQQEYWKRLCSIHRITIPHLVVKGGETRFHSVLNGLSLIPDEGIVAIHDGVRPLTAHRVIENCFHVAEEKGGAIPVLPLTDSLRQIFPDKSSKAVDRTAFVAVQTPQTFRVEEIKKAYKLPYNDTFTDDASVYEAAGYIPELVEGNRENLKITLPVDLAIAEIRLKE